MKAGIDYIGVATIFFCLDEKGNLLMGKRSKKCRDEQGRWDSGGGKLEFGLSLEENIRKEVKEEYSCEVSNIEFMGYRDVVRKVNGIRTHWLAMDFKMQVDPDQVRNGEPESIDEIGWFNLDSLPTPLHSQLPKALKAYSKILNKSK